MKIAQVAPVFERVPPIAYGGTERVVSYLTEELVRQGHEVTLFASGDSVTEAHLVATVECSLRMASLQQDWLVYQTMLLDQVGAMAEEFDVIHFHTDYLHFPLAKRLPVPHVTTLHGRLDLPELGPLYRHFCDVPLISISNSQRSPLPWVSWQGTVYHGLPLDLYSLSPKADDYFVFVGRISPEKRVDRAIKVAKHAGKRLYIAAKVDKVDEAYFDECIKPLLEHPLIEYLGELGEEEKHSLLQGAAALLFLIDWPEPFGLVVIEAFACGTPVLAYRNGSVPEIVDDGITGFIVSNQDEAFAAVDRFGELDRARCRRVFEQRFAAKRMADDYLAIYRRLQHEPSWSEATRM
ncbi:MAG TPA: glycosyltransferase family 4 protein [Methylophilaceae bacterium]|nr:glycosyltransferase family 4 protein [Methylophilaceae bacterium]